jgi:hypothetical protein
MTRDDLDPIGWQGAALPERPPILRTSEADAAPKLLSREAGLLLALLVSLVLWGVIWRMVATIWP